MKQPRSTRQRDTIMGKKPRIPQAASLRSELKNSNSEAEIKRLKEQLKASEASKAQLAAALERSRITPKARQPVPAKKPRTSGEELVRVIVPDTHGCKADRAALSACLGDIKALCPDEIVLLGDHVDCGGLLAQHHVMGYVAETSYTYEEDIASTNAFLDAVQSAAPRARIHYIEGNHERRAETLCVTMALRNSKDAEFLRKAIAPEFLLNLEARGIPYYRQGEFYGNLKIPGVIRLGKCYFTHGSKTSTNATASMLAAFGAPLVFGHTHRAQASSGRPVHSGAIAAWNPGCLCELQPLWMHTNPTSWTHGFGVQIVARSGEFLHLNIPIIGGKSLLGQLAGKFQ
jgi:predicted phosphodiesterase